MFPSNVCLITEERGKEMGEGGGKRGGKVGGWGGGGGGRMGKDAAKYMYSTETQEYHHRSGNMLMWLELEGRTPACM